MAAGNNSLEQTFGLVAAGTEILRQPGRVANGLSTITARLTKENDDYIASITKGMGVIDKNTGELRSTFDILQDLSEEWKNLTSVEKQELTETVAGKTQRALFTAIMENFETAVGATEAALNSEGSAVEENNKRMDSLNGKLTQLESAWQSLATNTINSDFVKNILDAVTGLINFADAAGGLLPILLNIGGALAIFKAGDVAKGITNLRDKFSELNKIAQAAGGGLQGYQIALSGVKTTEDATKISTYGLATAVQTLMSALGVITLALSAVSTVYNLVKKHQEEVRKASLESANAHLEEAKSYDEKISKEKEALEKLKDEKSLLEELSGTDDGTKEKIKDKQDEIDKRQKNIDKMKEEQKQASLKAIGDISGQKGKGTAGGIYAYIHTGVESEDEKLSGYVREFNAAVKEADGNTGKYNKTIEDMKTKYSELLSQQKKNGESYLATEKILQLLNREQEKNAKNYQKDTELAQIYYKALKNGIDEASAGQDMVNWMQEFYGLNESQMEQLKQGVDVLNEKTEATDNLTEAEKKYNEEMSNSQETQKKQEENFKNSVDDLAKLQENYNLLTQAQNEYNETGYLTADMYKKLQDAGLLQYLDETNGKLTFNTKEFNNNRKEIIASATDSIKKAYAEKVLQLALADQNGTLKEVAKSFGLVTEESNKVNSSNTVSQIARIGTMAASIFPTLGKVFNKVKQIFGQKTSDDGGLFDVSKYTGSEEYNKYKAELDKRMKADIAAINKVKLESAKVSKPKGKSTSGSKSKSRKSAKDTYKAEINLLYKYENALENAEEKVKKLQKALGNTESFSKQEKILKNLIKATDNQKKKTNDLRKAQTKQIKDYIKQLKKAGFQIKYNSKDNELNIKNMKHLKKFTGDTAKKYEEMIKNIQSLNKENRSLSESITDLAQDMKDYNEELNDIPTKKLEKYNELMEEFRQGRLDQIQGEITDLEREMKKDTKLNKLKAELEEMEKQNDALDSQNDKQEKLLALEQAKENLANKRESKTVQVFRERNWLGL